MDEINYKSIIEKQPYGYACLVPVFSDDGVVLDYEIIDCNSELEKILDLERNEIIGKSAIDFSKHFGGLDFPILDLFGSSNNKDIHQALEKVTFDNKSWYNILISKLNDNFFIAHLSNITSIVKTEDELISNTNFLNQLLNSIPDLIFFKDKNSIYLGGNNEFARYVGISSEEIKGKSDFQLFNKKTADFFVSTDKKVIEKRIAFQNEESTSYPNGQKVLLDTLKAPLFDSSGNLMGILGICRNITARKNIEEKLRISEENFRTFFETIDDLIIITSKEGQILFTNSAVSKKLGYSTSELIKMNAIYLFPESQRENALSDVSDFFCGKINNSQVPFISKSGELVFCETRFWMGKWDNVEALFTFSKDLSKEIENLDKFNRIFDNNPSLMVISRISDGAIMDINKSFIDKTGFNKENISNYNVNFLNSLVNFEKNLSLREKLSNKIQFSNEEIELVKKDGGILNGLFSAQIISSHDEKYYLTVMTDITEQKKAEDALVHQSKMQSLLMNISTNFIDLPISEVESVLNESLKNIGSFINADRAYIVDIVNSKAKTFFSWGIHDLNIDFFLSFIKSNQKPKIVLFPNVMDLSVKNKIKKSLIKNKTMSFIALPLSNPDGTPGFLVFESVNKVHYYSDIEITLLILYSEMLINVRNRMYQEKLLTAAKEVAEEASLAKSRFLANMSHEIRTPMNAILGFLQLLEQNETDPEQLEYIENIKISSDNLLYIINNLLDLSKIEAGKLDIEIIPFNLHSLIDEIIIQFNNMAKQQNNTLIKNIDQKVFKYVNGDPSRLRQILMNLVGNAIKFTDHGTISINVSMENEKEKTIKFSVIDDGIGMNEDVVKKVFNAFTQADSSSTRKYGGTGLGLSICKSLIDLMNGKVEIESKEGSGTRVSFLIKLEPADIMDELKLSNYISLKGKKILVVDENETSREVLKIFLQEAECMVVEAKNSNTAISLLIKENEKKFDMAILDHDLTDMSGSELATTLKSMPYTKNIPLVCLSFSDIENNSGCFIETLNKPIKRREFLDKISTLFKLSNGKTIEKITPEYKLNVLVVDDNEMNRNFLIKILEKEEYSYDIAENGIEAIRKFEKNKYDLILMDCQMPLMDGYEATENIRKMEKNNSHVLIVAMTAFALKGDKEKCLSVGMDDYLSKPINLNHLNKIFIESCILKGKRPNSMLTKEKEKILIVDDEPMNLKLLESILKEDYFIEIVSNGKEAIEKAVTFNPDIILLDIMMPEMNGYEVCKMLKELTETKDIPIIFLTAMKDEQSEEFGLKMGVVDYIIKPFSIPVVKGRIKNHVMQKKQNDLDKINVYIDELTQIPNRRKFNETLMEEWRRCKNIKKDISLLFLDIDHFKNYNDQFGHLEGDRCIANIATAITSELKRPRDLGARWGGEEFACILPETNLQGSLTIAERIRASIENLSIANKVTISIGVSSIKPSTNNTPEELLEKADKALYIAKESGRNQVFPKQGKV